ncbi:unnamed protein product [Gadus morhua 'NCC']
MDGVPCRWNPTRAPESLHRCRPTTGTLSRLAKLVAHVEPKPDSHSRKQPLACHSFGGPECDQESPNMTEHSLHQESKHALPKPHKCVSCGNEFSLLSSLQHHMCATSPDELGLARADGASDPDGLQDKSPGHQPGFIDSVPYACASCGRGFRQKQALLQHQQAVCGEPSLLSGDGASTPPADSPQSASEAGSSQSDSSEPQVNRTFVQCLFCPRKARSGAGIHCHMRTCHPAESRAFLKHQQAGRSEPFVLAGDGASPPPTVSIAQCLFCPRTSRTGAGLHCHMRKCHAAELLASEQQRVRCRASKLPKLLGCRSCEMVFKSTAMLYLHRKEMHSRETAPRSERIPVIPKRRKQETYPCQVCGRVFLHHLSLRAHSKQHSASDVTAIPKQGHSAEANARQSKYTERQPKNLHHALLTKGKSVRKTESLDEETALRSSRNGCKVEEEVESDFPCPSCAKVFSLQSELRNHAELHQSTAHWRQCSVCLQEMDTSKGLGSKKRRLYHCVPCQQTFPALDTFLKHCQDHLRVRVEEDHIAEAFGFHSNKNRD